MKKYLLIWIVGAPLWVACGKTEVEWSNIPMVSGDQAESAIATWKSSLDFSKDLEFPITLHWQMNFTLKDMPQLLGGPVDGFASIVMDSTLLGGNRYRTRAVIEIVVPSFDNYITVWLESDAQELRMQQRGLDSIVPAGLPLEIPAGLRLSADRQVLAFDFLRRIGSHIPGLSESDAKATLALPGACALFHPSNIVRFLGANVMQANNGWRASGESVQITYAPLKAFVTSPAFEGLKSSGTFAFLEKLADMEVVAEFERSSGALRSLDSSFHYAFEDLPTRGSVQPSALVTLHMELRQTEVGAVVFKERDEIFDLDDDFDSYWPTMAAFEPIIVQALQQVEEGIESGEDISF
jgi:hypothetical protein